MSLLKALVVLQGHAEFEPVWYSDATVSNKTIAMFCTLVLIS